MKRIASLLLFLVLFTPSWGAAQETINLTAPIVRANIGAYTPRSLFISLSPPRIQVSIADADGSVLVFDYPCASPCVNNTPASVTTLINALNTANLTTRSLWRRIFDRLILDFPTRFAGGATVP